MDRHTDRKPHPLHLSPLGLFFLSEVLNVAILYWKLR